MTDEKRHYNPTVTAALLVIGLLILVPSGLCTGIFGGSALLSMMQNPPERGADSFVLTMALAIGGPFIFGGGLMVWFAVRRMRSR